MQGAESEFRKGRPGQITTQPKADDETSKLIEKRKRDWNNSSVPIPPPANSEQPGSHSPRKKTRAPNTTLAIIASHKARVGAGLARRIVRDGLILRTPPMRPKKRIIPTRPMSTRSRSQATIIMPAILRAGFAILASPFG
jgi:hypothetical protein